MTGAGFESACELCRENGGEVLHRGDKLRVVLVDDPHYPGFCRVIWNAHAKEMSDLHPADRLLLMTAVWQVEHALREVLRPDKINLASLGNVVPHLHWHVIPRFIDDAQFPNPIWSGVRRTCPPERLAGRMALLPPLREKIVQSLQDVPAR